MKKISLLAIACIWFKKISYLRIFYGQKILGSKTEKKCLNE